jgi:pyrroline-5-carboxylate reductase
MKNIKIGFIGGGNMARSLISGLIKDGVATSQIMASAPSHDTRQALEAHFTIRTTEDNQSLVDHCDVVVLAVKPQILKPVISQLKLPEQQSPLFLTVAAGIPVASIRNWLKSPVSIVRAMPNTPALVQSGATGLYAAPEVTADQRDTAESIMRTAGLVQWLPDEVLMDAVTALSGSGPAYYFFVMEAMEKAGVALGLNEKTARLLSIQTALGAAKLALEAEEDPAVLRQRVTSPGGTTETAIEVLSQGGLMELFNDALTAARDRAVELAKELGE